MEEIEFSRWLFEGRPRQGKNVLPDGLNWLGYFAGSSKYYIMIIRFLPYSSSRHEKCCQMLEHFFGYFKALKPHGEIVELELVNMRLGKLAISDITVK